MSEILLDLSAPGLPAAMDANFAEEMACLARSLPGGELHEDGEIRWFYTGHTGFNGILHTSLRSNDKAHIDAKIEEALDYFRARNIRIGWPIGLSTQPTDLGTHLLAHGLTRHNDRIQMVLDMLAVSKVIPTVEGLIIKEVADQETLQLWRSITIRGFDITEEMGQIYYGAYKKLGFGYGYPWHHYLGWLNGEPVGTASLLLHAGLAGIYGVATIPEARRQGVGTRLTLHVINQARALGYRIAILSPSEMGMGMYQRIGFQEYSKTPFYLWSPS